jgi:hypothetical protein
MIWGNTAFSIKHLTSIRQKIRPDSDQSVSRRRQEYLAVLLQYAERHKLFTVQPRRIRQFFFMILFRLPDRMD